MMMHIGRGTYRVERRHLDDPLQPYLAPIRVDLPSFHIPIEYSAEPLPLLPPVIVHYLNGAPSFNGYTGGIGPSATAAMNKWKEEFADSNPREPTMEDMKVIKKRKRVKAEKKSTVREPRRSRTGSTPKRARSFTGDDTPIPSPTTAEPSPQPHPEPIVKLESVEHIHVHHFIPAPVRIYQSTTVIKQEPLQ